MLLIFIYLSESFSSWNLNTCFKNLQKLHILVSKKPSSGHIHKFHQLNSELLRILKSFVFNPVSQHSQFLDGKGHLLSSI